MMGFTKAGEVGENSAYGSGRVMSMRTLDEMFVIFSMSVMRFYNFMILCAARSGQLFSKHVAIV